MNRVVETLWRRSLNELGAGRELQFIIGSLAVGAPMAFVRPGIGIKNNDAVVEISVGHEQLVRLAVDKEPRGSSEVLRIVAAPIFPSMTDLEQKLPFVR